MRHSPWLFGLVLLLAACASESNLNPTFFDAPPRPLLKLAIEPPDTMQPYDRSEWPHWNHVPGTCHDIRAAVLVASSLQPATFHDSSGSCTVDSGLWVSVYSGDTLQNASDLDIDHLVPLHEAHRSGGASWDAFRKRTYANDTTAPYHLLAVDDSSNSSKGDRDPARWLPTTSFRCNYLAAWVTIKSRWELSMDSVEFRLTRQGLDSCAAAGVVGMPVLQQ